MIAGLTRMNCLFRFHDGSIRSQQVVEFLKALRGHLRRKLLIIWDGLQAHRSRMVRDYLDSTKGAVQVAFLPAYAPDCNPVEYLWAWLKRHALANFCRPRCTNSKSLLETSSRVPSVAGPSSWRAGNKLSFGSVINYVILTRTPR